MDTSVQVKLITQTYTTDSIGQKTATETYKTVFGRRESIKQKEWHDAGINGIKPEMRVTIFGPEYSDEEIVEIGGKRYGVYRTYQTRGDDIELYLEKKTGV